MKKSHYFFSVALPIALFAIINFLGIKIDHQIDFTENKKHSLAPTTKEYLSNLKQDISLNLIFTKSNSNIPFDHRVHHDRVINMLETMKKLSGGKLDYSLSDPSHDPSALEKAKFDGLTELLFSQGKIDYLGLTARCLTKNNIIPYLHPERFHLLEYDLLVLLDQITPKKRKKVGLISGLPVTGGEKSFGKELPPWLFVKELERSYEVLNYSKELHSLKSTPPDLLIVIHPIGFGVELEKSIDTYLQNGGNLILALDSHCVANSFLRSGDYLDRASSDLSKLLKAWGVKYDPKQVVADMNYASEINRGYGNELVHTVLTISKEAINVTHPITQGINSLGFPFSGYWELEKEHSWKEVLPLVFSSPNSALIQTDLLHRMDRDENQTFINSFLPDNKPKALVIELKGLAPKAFEDTPVINDREDNKIVLISDSDFVFDAFAGESQKISETQTQIKPYNGNIALLNNTIDLFLEREFLSETRSRGSQQYSLSKLADMKANIVTDFQEERAQLEQALVQVTKEKNELYTHTDDQTVDEQILINKNIEKKEKEIESIQKKGEQIEAAIEKQTSSLIAKIQWLNILTVPFIILLFGTIYIGIRTKTTTAQ